MNKHPLRPAAAAALLAAGLLTGSVALAQEAVIRKALAEHVPSLPKIDEVRQSPIEGVWEVRYGGTEILYTDAKGEHIVQGSIIDTKTMTNLTEQRLDKLNAVEFSALPLKDAVVIKQGTGTRKMAIFVDPNCGYCKRFERDVAAIKDVTIYAFLMPILGPDSNVKARDIWCSKDSAKTWRAWMLDGVTPQKMMGSCDAAALERNVAFGRSKRIQGTPAIFFEDGTRKPGAIPGEMVEKLLAQASTKKG
jgi:thiol:disulfide interchange protein DsbC